MARILLVDDDAAARASIAERLAADGHALLQARLGAEALELSAQQRPDLVILEVLLPDLNGFETAIRLKALCSDSSLPTLFLTSLVDQDSRNMALRIGADEFLSKPVDQTELRLRVRNHLARVELTRMLEQRNTELLEAGRFRDDMTSMIIHDLKNPLTVILSNVDFVAESRDIIDPSCQEALRDAQVGGQRILRLIANLLDMTRLEGGTMQLVRTPVKIGELVERLAGQRTLMARATGVTLRIEAPYPVEASIDTDLVTRVIENIVDNAFRYAPRGGVIQIKVRSKDGVAELLIGNSGPAIPVEARATIFEKYGQAGRHGRMNLGLGLYFCRLAIEAHGGALTVEDDIGLPTVFAIRVPALSS